MFDHIYADKQPCARLTHCIKEEPDKSNVPNFFDAFLIASISPLQVVSLFVKTHYDHCL